MPNLHILLPRLKQPHLIPSKQRRERDIKLRIRQIHPHARPRAPTKRHQLPPHPLHLLIRRPQPAVRVKGLGIHKHGAIIVHVHRVHGHGRVGRDDVVLVAEGRGGRDAGHAADDAVGEAESFFYDGGEVGEGFEVAPEGDGVGVRDGGCELGFEEREDARGAEEVVGYGREGVPGRFVTSDDEEDAFVREAVEALLFRGHLFVVRHFVEDGRDGLGFGFDLCVRVGRLGDLLLDDLFLEDLAVVRFDAGEGREDNLRDGTGSFAMLRGLGMNGARWAAS